MSNFSLLASVEQINCRTLPWLPLVLLALGINRLKNETTYVVLHSGGTSKVEAFEDRGIGRRDFVFKPVYYKLQPKFTDPTKLTASYS